MRVDLVSPLPDSGYAYNQGAFWPMGLLSIGSFIDRELPDVEVNIIDQALIEDKAIEETISAPIVGIQATSCMTYKNVLRFAEIARRKGAFVVLGGPFASELADRVLLNRLCVDAVVVGAGEEAMLSIVTALSKGGKNSFLRGVPGVVVRGDRLTTEAAIFDYEGSRPLNYNLLPVAQYHRNYRARINPEFDGAFQIFTHFGCKFRSIRQRAGREWCSYCALGGGLSVRDPEEIRREIGEALRGAGVRCGARLMLKCYGDNASALGNHLNVVASSLKGDTFLRRFDLAWSLYAQSVFITPRLIEVFKRLGVYEVYVGFDSADDEIQKRNGLGTTQEAHWRAAELLRAANIKIHAGFVLGCAGETTETLRRTVDFAVALAGLGNVDMFHASPLVVLPGSPAFRMLKEEVPRLAEVDFFDTVGLQIEWLSHFCPDLGDSALALKLLEGTARMITDLGRIPSSFGGWRERVAADLKNP